MSGKPDSGCNALRQKFKNKMWRVCKFSWGGYFRTTNHLHVLKNVYLHVRRRRKCLGFIELLLVEHTYSCTEKVLYLIWSYFLANDIFIALVWVILKPCSASRAAPACTSLSNSTKAMSWRPGTRRTSLNPGNLNTKLRLESALNKKNQINIKAESYWLVEQHGKHEFVRLFWKVGEEEDVIGRIFWNLWR